MSYPIGSENQINRLRNRAKYDYKTVHGIVAATPVLHVSFDSGVEDSAPAILPMIGAMGLLSSCRNESSREEASDLYLHGSISARLMRERREELEVCVAVTKVDGYVLALTPFHHSYNFRSAILHGAAEVVKDEQERLFAMELITNKVVPGQWNATRPPTKVELQSTQILRVRIASASAKVRWGAPNAERRDLKDSELVQRCWSGVVPMWEKYGEPVSGPDNRAPVAQHVKDFVSQNNAANESIAYGAAQSQ